MHLSLILDTTFITSFLALIYWAGERHMSQQRSQAEIKGQLGRVGSLLLPCECQELSQVIRLGSKHITYLLSHPIGPCLSFLNRDPAWIYPDFFTLCLF